VKVFISWSGERSRQVAEALRDWLPQVLQFVDPWLSARDIDKGARWGAEIASELNASQFGIICVTPENQSAPWLLFEAGAISKQVDQSRVTPYLFKMRHSDLKQPLALFQAAIADKDETLALLKSINAAVGSGGGKQLMDSQIEAIFKAMWTGLQKSLSDVPTDEPSAPPARPEKDLLEEVLSLVRGLAVDINSTKATAEAILQARQQEMAMSLFTSVFREGIQNPEGLAKFMKVVTEQEPKQSEPKKEPGI
jgi:hypothetical protein